MSTTNQDPDTEYGCTEAEVQVIRNALYYNIESLIVVEFAPSKFYRETEGKDLLQIVDAYLETTDENTNERWEEDVAGAIRFRNIIQDFRSGTARERLGRDLFPMSEFYLS